MKATIYGFELRHGVDQAIHKFCSAFGRPNVTVHWSRTATTAGISAGGDIVLPDVRDDAVISKALFVRYVGYALHELAHHVFTDFNVNGGDQYLRSLHNAVEDIGACRTEGSPYECCGDERERWKAVCGKEHG